MAPRRYRSGAVVNGQRTKATATASRALVLLLAAAAVLAGAPVPHPPGAQSDAHHRPDRTVAAAAPLPPPVAYTRHDPGTATAAVPPGGGDQRPAARDLPEGYAPAHGLLPHRAGPWVRVPLPQAAGASPTPVAPGLPLGRDPPPTVRV
ncbi:hypothetical protein FHX37_0177 [Haloactinospora alba]|uniref:Uncharacterized protein n=1 Tax=Haloactinospora alba TaxID=405555 RepID=A0A543NEQ1_9ACTN|nr:hypothetical protein [Haloactinospora alba]TQN30305.1 hypothetical protein FHX37_0177 [Haloactinospora alba]